MGLKWGRILIGRMNKRVSGAAVPHPLSGY